MNQIVDRMKQLLEIAITSGRIWQSPQSGYIQYYYTQTDEDYHHTSPTYENFLFVLALMRSKLADNINEAKEMLDRLLEFQSESGNFPIYLHEYSNCKDRYLAVNLIAPLYWIYKNFHHILGGELKKKLESSLEKLIFYSLSAYKEKQPSYQVSLKIAAGARAIGTLLNRDNITKQGEALLEQLEHSPQLKAECSPTVIAEMLVAFQMIYPSLSNSPVAEFWNHIVATYHYPSATYCGPGLKESQQGLEPQITLYDYFMGYFSGNFSYRSFFNHPVQLQAALVHPSEDKIELGNYPFSKEGTIDGSVWKVKQFADCAYSILGEKNNVTHPNEKLFIPFKLVWGSGNRVRSFVCQGGNIQDIDFTTHENQIVLFLKLAPEFEVENREKSQEVSFFIDQESPMQISVEGMPSTTFQLGQDVVILNSQRKISMNFEIHHGEGQLFGHIMKGNRPSQILNKGKNRFDAFDWQIFLRTIQRSGQCVVKVTITTNT